MSNSPQQQADATAREERACRAIESIGSGEDQTLCGECQRGRRFSFAAIGGRWERQRSVGWGYVKPTEVHQTCPEGDQAKRRVA